MVQPFVSIVIPAYNEEARISDTLKELIGYLNSRSYTWEILVADDGSTDATGALVSELAAREPKVRLISLPHRGKGWAVKNGMLAACGAYRLLCDADLSVPVDHLERVLPPQLEGIDIAIGSREAPGARRIGEPARRHIMGRAYNTLVRFLAVPGIRDTQCGFKCFRQEIVPELFRRQTTNGFAFDVELLFLARKAGLKLMEIPVDWYYREHSKVRPLHDSWTMTLAVLKIRWRYLLGKYRHDATHKQAETNTL